MAEGNRHLGFKEVLERARGPLARREGRVPVRLLEPRPRAFAETADDERVELAACLECGAPTTARALRVLLPAGPRRAPGPSAGRAADRPMIEPR